MNCCMRPLGIVAGWSLVADQVASELAAVVSDVADHLFVGRDWFTSPMPIPMFEQGTSN